VHFDILPVMEGPLRGSKILVRHSEMTVGNTRPEKVLFMDESLAREHAEALFKLIENRLGGDSGSMNFLMCSLNFLRAGKVAAASSVCVLIQY